MKTFKSTETFRVTSKSLVMSVRTTKPPRIYDKVLIDDKCFRVTKVTWHGPRPSTYNLTVKYTSMPRPRSYDCPETKRRKEVEIRLIVKAREVKKLMSEIENIEKQTYKDLGTCIHLSNVETKLKAHQFELFYIIDLL